MVKYAFVKAGESWRSEPVITRLYEGDWHEAPRTYRAWTKHGHAKPSLAVGPAKVRNRQRLRQLMKARDPVIARYLARLCEQRGLPLR